MSAGASPRSVVGGKVFWNEMRWPEIQEAAEQKACVIVPVGSIEQHGPHCPVDLDISCPSEIAVRAANAATDFRVIVAPSVSIGYTPHNMFLPGTITLSMETFSNVLVEVCQSIRKSGFEKIFLLNGHGGNHAVMEASIIRLYELGIMVAGTSYWKLAPDAVASRRETPLGGMGHACEFETSLQLHFRPHLVEMNAAKVEYRQRLTSFFPIDMFDTGTVFYAPDYRAWGGHQYGVMGDPTKASAEKGKAWVDAIVGKVLQFLAEFRKIP